MKQKLFFLLFIVYAFSHGQKIELGKSYPNGVMELLQKNDQK